MNPKSTPIPDPVLEQATDWMFRRRSARGDRAFEAALQAWIDESEVHARAWALAEKTWRASGQARPAFAHEWPDTTSRVPIARRRTHRIAAAAMGLAACLALVVAWPAIRVELAADHATATAEVRRIALADGSVVHLGADSAIAADYNAGDRTVTLLKGEAFFQVVPDRAWPFTVRADNLTVTVTGTAFDVGFTDRTFSVAVASGSVRVNRAGISDAAAFDLRPGQGLTIDRATGAAARAAVSVGSVAAWRAGRLIVENAALADAAEAIGRHHRGFVAIADARLKESRVTGVFDLNDLVRALRALAAAHGGTVREIGSYLLVMPAD